MVIILKIIKILCTREGIFMNEMSAELINKLSSKTSFTIPLFGGIPVPESVLVTWVIMAVLVVASILLTRKLDVQPKGIQLYLETTVSFINDTLHENLGHNAKQYTSYLGTVGLYLVVSNTIGIFGITPPTKDLNVTAALALMSIVLIEYAGIRAKGFKGFLKSFGEPVAFIAPMNVLEVFIRPVSLCMRLFGNILGAFIIMELIKIVVPAFVPIPFSMYFDLFDGILQAYIFVFLTSLFIGEATE